MLVVLIYLFVLLLRECFLLKISPYPISLFYTKFQYKLLLEAVYDFFKYSDIDLGFQQAFLWTISSTLQPIRTTEQLLPTRSGLTIQLGLYCISSLVDLASREHRPCLSLSLFQELAIPLYTIYLFNTQLLSGCLVPPNLDYI